MPIPTRFDILLVDDEPAVVRILSRMLSDYAPHRFATSGQTALKLARQCVPDLVLLDVEMPDLNGFEVCKAFKSDPSLEKVPIIFITSHDSAELEAKGLELGAADFLHKPPRAAVVQARVRTYRQIKVMSDTLRGMDFLTGAATRRRLETMLAQEWERALRSGAPLAFVLADIDHFAQYNAQFGEQQGDACLRSVAEALRTVLRRPTDVLARYSGRQFAILLPDTDADGALVVAHRAAAAVAALSLSGVAGAGARKTGLSVGIGYRSPSKSAGNLSRSDSMTTDLGACEDLIAAAQQALQRAQSHADSDGDRPAVLVTLNPAAVSDANVRAMDGVGAAVLANEA